jgi:hypothetical protein
MPVDFEALVAIPVVFGSIVVVTVSIIRYKLALRDDLNYTRAQLAEMQERLDFAERMLTAGRASQDEKGK